MLRALALAALVGLAACESATDSGRRQPGELSGSWAGERFEGDASAMISGDSPYVYGGSPGGPMSPREVQIRIADFDGPGEYQLSAGGGLMHYILGGDVITSTYSIPPGGTGTLVVSEMRDGEIRGHVEFKADAHPGHAPVGTRARFEGDFRGVVSRPSW
jgi:hypothetical protein